jgi:hypothetical protein
LLLLELFEAAGFVVGEGVPAVVDEQAEIPAGPGRPPVAVAKLTGGSDQDSQAGGFAGGRSAGGSSRCDVEAGRLVTVGARALGVGIQQPDPGAGAASSAFVRPRAR